MGEQMEQRERIGRRPQAHDHVAQLRQRGIGHHALDVVLDQAHQAHQEGGRRSNRENDVQRHIAEFKQRRHPRNHENTRRDHGSRVDQRRTGRGAIHRIGQPHMQRELGRLAHGANEQANGGDGDNRPSEARHRRRRQRIQPQEDLRVVERAGVGNDQSDP